MATLSVRDAQINVDIFENKAPVDTYFIHGNLAANVWWEPALSQWKSQGDGKLFCFEWRGCGKSSAPTSVKQLDMDELAKDLIATIDQLSPGKKVNLVGHSTGGMIALKAIIQQPDKFNKLVLLDSVGAKGADLQPEILAAMDQMKTDKELCAQVMSSTIKDVDMNSDLFKRIVDKAFGVADLNWKGVLESLSHVDIRDQLSKIYLPVLVLHGQEDPILPIADSQYLAETLPNAQFEALAGHGHSLNVENPTKFNNLVTQFLF